MRPTLRISAILFLLACLGIAAFHPSVQTNLFHTHKIGDPVDSLHGVVVYYNGSVSHTAGRHLAPDGYNLGLKYQCVEFAKRYYYQRFNHRMLDTYGHAVSFFNPSVSDGKLNKARNLTQFTNGSKSKPHAEDLVVWKGNTWNPYGHIAVICKVENDQAEIIQQNPGPMAPSRIRIKLIQESGLWKLQDEELLGWLGIRSAD